MSDFMQAALIGGGIAAAVFASQLGRRDLSWHKIVFPLLSVAGFGFFYLKDAPTGSAELVLYAAGVGLGLVFAAIATLTTRMDRDVVTGKVMTVCGAGFVATWLVALGARLGFIALADHDDAFRAHLGEFMLNHELHESSIAPFFVIWALTMVVARIAAVQVRARQYDDGVAAGKLNERPSGLGAAAEHRA